MAVRMTQKRLTQLKKELKAESSADIHNVLLMVQAMDRLLQEELRSRDKGKR